MMNVERGQHSAVHGGHAGHAAGKAGKSGHGAAAGDAPAAGFMALLSALDDALDGGGDSAELLGEAADTLKDAAAALSDAATAGQAAPDASAISAALAATLGDAAARQGLRNDKPPAATTGDASAIDADGKAAGRRAQPGLADHKTPADGAPADKALMDNAPGMGRPGGAANAGAGAGVAAAAVTDSASTPTSLPQAARGDLATVFEQLQNRLAARGDSDDLAQASDAQARAVAAAAARPAAAAAAAESRADRSDRMASLSAAMPSFRQTVGADDAATQVVKGIEARPAQDASVSRSEPGTPWMQREFTPTVQFDGSIAGADATQAAPEAQIADQVSYWISQGIRNAELTVGGGGSDPVQVSITMTGNEAQVEFRAEHAGVREMLANSVDHLKEALRSEGMLLAGVSVGSSGADAAGQRNAQSGQARDGATPGAAARASGRVETAATSATGGSPGRAPAGTVDLFV